MNIDTDAETVTSEQIIELLRLSEEELDKLIAFDLLRPENWPLSAAMLKDSFLLLDGGKPGHGTKRIRKMDRGLKKLLSWPTRRMLGRIHFLFGDAEKVRQFCRELKYCTLFKQLTGPLKKLLEF